VSANVRAWPLRLLWLLALASVAVAVLLAHPARPVLVPQMIVGTSLDWRSAGNGEQLLVRRGTDLIAIVESEHSPYVFGSQIGFQAEPVPCVPKIAQSCFVMTQYLGLYSFQPPRTRVTIRAVLVSESTTSITVAAMASPAAQPRLLFTFPAAARTLAAATVHTGGLVEVNLRRIKGGAQGPEASWSPYSWVATSFHAT
jgi:hypothetical protein